MTGEQLADHFCTKPNAQKRRKLGSVLPPTILVPTLEISWRSISDWLSGKALHLHAVEHAGSC